VRRALPLLALAAVGAIAAILLLRDDGTSGRAGRGADSTESATAKPAAGGTPAPAAAPRETPAERHGIAVDASDGRPVPGVSVAAFRFGERDPELARSGADGRFAIGREATFLLATHPDFAPAELSAPFPEPLRIVLSRGGAISGRVVSLPDRTPVERFDLLAVEEESGEFDENEVILRQTLGEASAVAARAEVSDPHGRFRAAPLSAGSYHLLVRPQAGWPHVSPAVGVEEGREREGVEIELPPRVPFRFEVVDAATGAPLDGVSFHAVVDLAHRPYESPAEAERLPDGAYRIELPLDDRGFCRDFAVIVRAEGHAPARRSFGGWPPDHAFRIALGSGGRLFGVVFDGEGRPAATALVVVEIESCREVAAQVPCDEGGRFETGALPAAERLVLRAYDGPGARLLGVTTLRLSDGERREVALGGADASLLVRVTDGGAPVARALVALDPEGGERLVVWTGADGAVRAGPLPAGRCAIFVNGSREGAPDRLLRARAQVAAGVRTEVALDFARTIRGTAFHARSGEIAKDAKGLGIVARRDDGAFEGESALLDDGTFVIAVPAPGAYALDVAEGESPRAAAPARADLTSALAVEGVRLLLREAAPSTMRLTLKDALSGEPLPGGGFRYWGNALSGSGTFGGGTLELDELLPGKWTVVVTTELHAPGRLEFEVPEAGGDLEQELLLQRSDSLRIVSVEAGGAAAVAGLREGDRILAYAGRPVRNIGELRAAMEGVAAGGRTTVEIARGAERLLLDVAAGRLRIETENSRAEG